MLLAKPAQAASYSFPRHAPATAPINSSSSKSNNKNIIINNNNAGSRSILNHSSKLAQRSDKTLSKLAESSHKNPGATSTSTKTTLLMKTISVRANNYQSNDANASVNSHKRNDTTVVGNSNKTLPNTSHSSYVGKHVTKSTISTIALTSTVNVKSTSSTTHTTTATTSSSNKIKISASFLKAYTIPPTDLHRSSEIRLRSPSIDSLHDEMGYFKPIRSVPTTPWKCGSKSRGATLKIPKPCLAERNLNCDVDPPTTRTFSRGRENKRERSTLKSKILPKLSADLFPYIKPNSSSAFVRITLPMSCYTIPTTSALKSQKFGKHSKRSSSKSTTSRDDIDDGYVDESATKRTKAQPITKKPKTISKKKQSKNQQIGGKIQSKEKPSSYKETKNSKSKISNTKKRKAQMNSISNEVGNSKKIKSLNKKSKDGLGNRKTPPLTRGRIRSEGNHKLHAPLA